MKIVVSGAARQMNLGGPSIFHGLVQVLRRVFPGCEIAYHEAGAGFSGAGPLRRGPEDGPEKMSFIET